MRDGRTIRLGAATLLLAMAFPGVSHSGTLRFSSQSKAAGLVVNHHPIAGNSFFGGGTVGDFNGDHWGDVFVPVGGQAPDRLFLNDRDGTFSDASATFGVDVSHRSTGAAPGDFDNDGFLDLYVTSRGPVDQPLPGFHRLYHNVNGQGFQDVAAAMGVNFTSAVKPDGMSAAWSDYDQDGDLDLAVAGWQGLSGGNCLFRNDGTTFTDVTAAAGLFVSAVNGFTPRFIDMDLDLDPDLILIGDFSTSQYYVNNGDGTFTDATAASGTSHDSTEMGITHGDYDEDGDLDFYVSTILTNNLYLNQGGHVFHESAAAAGVVNSGFGWGAISVDFDHDTRIDISVASASNLQYLFLNQTPPGGSLTFTEAAQPLGLTSTVSGRGLSNFDYDQDGDQDLVIFPWNGPVELYRNDLAGEDTHWLRVSLDPRCSTTIPTDGIGSLVRIKLGTRELLRTIDGGSNYMSSSEPSAHFGLGAATFVDELKVLWADGSVTILTDVASDQHLTLSPPSPAVDLGAGKGGSLGKTPHLSFCGSLASGQTATLFLEEAAPDSTTFLIASGQSLASPSVAGTLLPLASAGFVMILTTDNMGHATVSGPSGGGPATLFVQCVVADAAAEFGYASSNALRLDLAP